MLLYRCTHIASFFSFSLLFKYLIVHHQFLFVLLEYKLINIHTLTVLCNFSLHLAIHFYMILAYSHWAHFNTHTIRLVDAVLCSSFVRTFLEPDRELTEQLPLPCTRIFSLNLLHYTMTTISELCAYVCICNVPFPLLSTGIRPPV